MAEPAVLDTASEIRITILSDSRLFGDGLRRILAADPSLVVVGHAGTVREIVRTISAHILLADVHLEGTFGLCRDIRREGSRPWVILLLADADEDGAVRALEAGARGVLSKTASAEDLIKAIRVVHQGQIWASNTVMARVVETLANRSAASHDTETLLAQRLSRRENEVVRYAAGGLSNHEVAHRLGISEATVKAHLTRIFQKLGIRNRAQLGALYHRRLAQGLSERTA